MPNGGYGEKDPVYYCEYCGYASSNRHEVIDGCSECRTRKGKDYEKFPWWLQKLIDRYS